MNLPKFNSKTSTKQKIVNLLIASVIIIIADVYFVILPFKSDIEELRRSIINEKIKLEKQLERQKNSANLESTINQVKEELKRIEGSYIKKDNELEFITTLEGVAAKNKVQQKISLQQDGKKDEKKSYFENPLVLEIAGSHDNFVKYLNDIESLNYYININSIEIIAGDQAGEVDAIGQALGSKKTSVNTIKARLTASTYWR